MNGKLSLPKEFYGFYTIICLQISEIFKKVFTAIFITPGKVSLINSNNFLHTVYKKLWFCSINLGNWPTRYIIFDAIVALFSLPFFYSTRFNRSLKILIKNFLSSDLKNLPSSSKHPLNDPAAQHSVFKFSKLYYDPSI